MDGVMSSFDAVTICSKTYSQLSSYVQTIYAALLDCLNKTSRVLFFNISCISKLLELSEVSY